MITSFRSKDLWRLKSTHLYLLLFPYTRVRILIMALDLWEMCINWAHQRFYKPFKVIISALSNVIFYSRINHLDRTSLRMRRSSAWTILRFKVSHWFCQMELKLEVFVLCVPWVFISQMKDKHFLIREKVKLY